MQSGMVYNIQRMSTEDGPGMRTTVFLKGCPLRCQWCSNPESQNFQPQLMVFEDLCTACGQCREVCPYNAVIELDGKYNRDLSLCRNCGACIKNCPSKARVMSGEVMTVEDVMKIVRKDSLFYANSGGGVTFGGGEPASAGDFLVALLEASQDEGLHICVDTSGHCSAEQFAEILARTELFLFDCKHMDPEQHKKLTGHDNSSILANLRTALASSVPVRIRIPLMPGLNDDEANIEAMAEFLKEYGKTEVDVLPYHAFGHNKYAALRLNPPDLQAYEPSQLSEVLERFKRAGLKVTIA